MKIARHPSGFASTRLNGTAHPGSLSEGAAERSEAEGVSFDGSSGPMVTRKPLLALKLLTAYVHRSTLPQSRIRSTAPSGREPGGAGAIQRAARKPQGCGRFSSPLRNSKTVSLYHSSDDTPSVSHSLDSSLREGAGEGCIPFIVPVGNRKVAGDFHRPYENSEVGTFCHSKNCLDKVVY